VRIGDAISSHFSATARVRARHRRRTSTPDLAAFDIGNPLPKYFALPRVAESSEESVTFP
jgi:hypothetical protein